MMFHVFHRFVITETAVAGKKKKKQKTKCDLLLFSVHLLYSCYRGGTCLNRMKMFHNYPLDPNR